jgi:hypothetical protein
LIETKRVAMNTEFRRFIIPSIFCIAGIGFTLYIMNWLVVGILRQVAIYDLIHWIPGRVPEDVIILQLAVILITIIEFLILAIPLSYLFLIVNKIVRVSSYSQSIMKTGDNFGWLQILRRAVVPALLSVASGELAYNLLAGILFPDPPQNAIRNIGQPYFAFSALIGSLILLPVALLFFIPTWILNDSGIISHLKPEQLNLRKCRDTIGVGSWFSNFLGGFSIIAIPISSFMQHFYKPYVEFEVALNTPNILVSFTWTIGLPLMAMAFLIPVIFLNELLTKWTRGYIQSFAKRLGAEEENTELDTEYNQHL